MGGCCAASSSNNRGGEVPSSGRKVRFDVETKDSAKGNKENLARMQTYGDEKANMFLNRVDTIYAN